MSQARQIRVIAAKGRRVPIHRSVGTGTGGALLIVGDDQAVTLPDVGYVRRRLRAGDLVEVKPAPAIPTPAPAPAVVKKEI